MVCAKPIAVHTVVWWTPLLTYQFPWFPVYANHSLICYLDITTDNTITIEEVSMKAGIELDVLSKECSEAVLLDMANLCVDWQLIGKHLKLTEAEIAAVNGDNRTTEEKRVAVLEKWKEKLSFKATYLALIKALLAVGKSSLAIDAAKIIRRG